MINKIVIEIDGKNYTIPKVITVTHYSEMMMKMSFSETATEKAYDVIGTLLNIPYKILRELNPDSLADLSIYLQNKVVECDIPYEHTFKFNNVEYTGVIFNKMTLGEYIDMVSYVKDDNAIYTNIHKLCALFYRPLVDGKIAPYNIEAHEIQSELFKKLPLKFFFGLFKNLFTFLAQLRKQFEVLFGEEDDKRKVFDDKGEEIKEDGDNSNLSWYRMIMVLANDDFTKLEFVTARPLVECFNHLTYIKIRNDEAKKLHDLQKAKMN